VLLTADTDWEEIRELVTESYRVLAPKKLSALLKEHALAVRWSELARCSRTTRSLNDPPISKL
jgi:hypothetical protein